MKAVFNAPVGTHGLGQFFRGECPGSDVVALFRLDSLGPHLVYRVDAADNLALRPGSGIDHTCSGQDRSDLADQTAVGFLDPFVAGRFCSPVQEGVLDCLQQARLIALDRQQVVATLGDDLVGDELLATHSVDTDEKALEVEGRQEFGNGHDLVALAGHFLLAEDQPQVGGEGAYHVQRILPTIPRAAGRLAIDGEGATQGGYHPADPAAKRGFELLGIEEPENAQESVLGRHPVLQHQEAAQPSFTHPRPMRDVFDRVRIGEAAAIAITRISLKSCNVPLLGRRGSSISPKQALKLIPFVPTISSVEKTRVDALPRGFTRSLCKALNVNDFPHGSMTIEIIQAECGSPDCRVYMPIRYDENCCSFHGNAISSGWFARKGSLAELEGSRGAQIVEASF